MAKKLGKKPTVAVKSSKPTPKAAAVSLKTKSAKPAAKAVAAAKSSRAAKPVAQPTKTIAKPANGKATVVTAKPATNGKSATNGHAGKATVAKAPAATVVAATPARPMLSIKPVAAVGKGPVKSAAAKSAQVAALSAERKPVAAKVAKPKPEPVPVRLPPAPVRSDSKMARNRAGITAKELEHFRDLLFEKRREITGDVSSMEGSALRNNAGGLSTLPMHMADNGTDNYEQEFTLGLVQKDRELLRDINVALAKIQDGSYGICEGTGNPISKPRLEAQPWAKYSIEHARQLERSQFRRAF